MLRLLLALFIIVPLAELGIFMALGKNLGLLNTIAIIFLTAILGASLTKSQGLQVLRKFQTATNAGKLPHEEIVDGLLILIAGAVLLTPGFLTDTLGFLLLIPPSRAAVRRIFSKVLKEKIKVSNFTTPHTETETTPPSAKSSGTVIDI